MNNKIKTWIIVAVSLILIGGIIFAGVMSALRWDFMKLSTTKYETHTYEISENYKNISITTKWSDIEFLPGESTKIVCKDETRIMHTAFVEGDTLNIELNDTRKWYDHITFFSFTSPKITVYMPEGAYGELSIKLSTGDVKIPDNFEFDSININASTSNVSCNASAQNDVAIRLSTGDISLESITAGNVMLTATTGNINASNIKCEGEISINVTTGDAVLSNVTCENLTSGGSTGDIALNSVVARQDFSIKRSTGDVKFNKCDASEIFADMGTGDVKGTLLSEKVFICKTDTGDVDVPESTSGGKCKITTDTGDIDIKVEK